MKVAYLAHWRGGAESGIFHKVAGQTAAWSALGADVGLFVATSAEARPAWAALPAAISVRTPPSGPLAKLREREALVGDVLDWRPDVVYVRHGLAYPGFVRLVRRTRVVIEINGDDLAEAALLSKAKHAVARVTRGSILRRAAGLVFVTRELAERPSFAHYHRPSLVVANGIDMSMIEPVSAASNEQPHLVFVGHPDTPWHGLDHIQEMAAAFPAWQFDVVGPSPDEIDVPRPNLRAHGSLERPQYRDLLAQADVAIGTLGLYRKHMEEASSLKVREYLAVGLPVVIGHRDTDFPEPLPFILQVPNREDGVRTSLPAIAEFAARWSGQRVRRADVAFLDTAVKECVRLDFLEQVARG